MEIIKSKPSLDEVLAYAEKRIQHIVKKVGAKFPLEHRDEMAQVARLRVFEAYSRIESDKGWKSFVQRHCRGAVLDYLIAGNGFEEVNRVNEKNRKEKENIDLEKKIKCPPLTRRVQYLNSEGDDIPVETILGMMGIYSEQGSGKKLDVNWNLVARMSRVDTDIHLVAKLLLGFTQTELSSMFQVSRERLTQRLKRFCEDLDAPELVYSNWVSQTIYAFGLSSHFNQNEKDLGFGWEYDPVDLHSRDINYIYDIAPQMHFRFVMNK